VPGTMWQAEQSEAAEAVEPPVLQLRTGWRAAAAWCGIPSSSAVAASISTATGAAAVAAAGTSGTGRGAA